MSNIQHHPSTDLLLDYSAGTAETSQAICVAAHLEHCASCRALHRRNNAIGGRLVETLNGANASVSDLKDKLFAQLDDRKRVSTNEAYASDHVRDTRSNPVPRALAKLIPNGFERLKWQIISTTARSSALFKEGRVNVSLLKLLPGGRVARHGHMGQEFTLVLTGSFSDESGVYRPGDFICRDKSDCHTPVATKDAECICLVVQEAPLQFTQGFFRFFNPFLRWQFS